MNRFRILPFKLVASITIVVMILLAGFALIPITACHATGNHNPQEATQRQSRYLTQVEQMTKGKIQKPIIPILKL